jgi:NAD-dependent deacetylase
MLRATPDLSIAPRLVVLSGAGISNESGLETFRDPDCIWSRVRIEDVATPDAFARDPARVQAFYNARRRGLLATAVRPNPAHLALAQLEAAWPGGVLIVTQNIDDLHERAGSRNIRHIHGELLKSRCLACGNVARCVNDLSDESSCPHCAARGRLRPHVVWFGEMPLGLDEVYGALSTCAMFVSIGTSGQVYPAAGFVTEASAGGAHTVELNLEPSSGHTLFAERIYGRAGEIVPRFVERLLARSGAS